MKKYGLIIIVVLLLVASIVLSYNLNNKLKTSVSLSESLESELEKKDTKNEELDVEVSSLTETLGDINKQLQDKINLIKTIDDKLKAVEDITEGDISEQIDELIIYNNKLKDELDMAIDNLNILEDENSKTLEGLILTEVQKEEWVKSIDIALELLDDRKSFMADGISILPKLSLERVMIEQEIDFLDSIYSNMSILKEDILIK